MNNISLDTTSFSEQLGIYDFLNVLLSGAIFVFGCSTISSGLNSWLWGDATLSKGIGIVLAMYIIGMVLQELGATMGRHCFKIYEKKSSSILKGKIDNNFCEKVDGGIVSNPLTLKQYQENADKLLKGFTLNEDGKFENDNVSRFVFSVCQYYVSIKGKDKKVEKLRALFNMSETLIICFWLLSIMALISIAFIKESSVLTNMPTLCCDYCSGKILLAIIFALIGLVFYKRAQRTMKNFLLILLGTYDAIIRAEEKEPEPRTTEV